VVKEEFSEIRQQLGKTQKEMAQLLGTSAKSIESFEQGWREIPLHIERQLLFLLASIDSQNSKNSPCWVIQKCPIKTRRSCPAWEFQVGHICWFINGTICHGEVQESWKKKMKICRQCNVFQLMLPTLYE
jgi:DNA-binding XRE family transcriptional regulator